MTVVEEEYQERRENLQLVLQESRYVILQYVIGHPQELITLEELDHLVPDRSRSTLHSHLSRLLDADVLERQVLPEEDRQRDLPHVFYGLSDDGEELLERHSLLQPEDTLQELYSKIEKDSRTRKYETAPRPK